ncbi:MAG: hypothetical protein AAFY65_13165 [Pseudomonadota bacterium]
MTDRPKRRLGPYLGGLAVITFLGLLIYAYNQVQSDVADRAATEEDSSSTD